MSVLSNRKVTIHTQTTEDVFYATVVACSDDLRPIPILEDHGSKPARSANLAGSQPSAAAYPCFHPYCETSKFHRSLYFLKFGTRFTLVVDQPFGAMVLLMSESLIRSRGFGSAYSLRSPLISVTKDGLYNHGTLKAHDKTRPTRRVLCAVGRSDKRHKEGSVTGWGHSCRLSRG